MTSRDEALRALADECDGLEGLGSGVIAQRIRAILATASEQAPVAWEYRVRGIDAMWVRGEGSINADYNDEYWEVRYLYDHPSSPAHTSEARDATHIVESARRLVQHAEWQLGGALSAESTTREIPSRAASQVKARHLASLRDALRKYDAAMRQEGGNG